MVEEELEEVIEKGDDELFKIFILAAVGDGEIVNLEPCFMPIGPALDAGLFIL